MKKPFALTFIGWITLIAAPIVFLISFWKEWYSQGLTLEMLKIAFEYQPQAMLINFLIIGGGVLLVIIKMISGVLLIKSKRLGRTLYLICTLVTFILAFIETSEISNGTEIGKLVQGAIVSLVYLYFLYRRKVTEYFDYVELADKN